MLLLDLSAVAVCGYHPGMPDEQNEQTVYDILPDGTRVRLPGDSEYHRLMSDNLVLKNAQETIRQLGAENLISAVDFAPDEQWLLANNEALSSVASAMVGVSKGVLSQSPPDIDADRELADQIDEDA